MPASHPSPQILEAFAFGKLDDTVASDTVIQHLETCVDCREKVTGMSGDSFLERMRAAREPSYPTVSKVPVSGAENAGASGFADLPPELRDNQQYEVLRELGRGGMGVVYLAKNRLMDRLEVLKVLSTSMLSRSSALDRFLREIRAAAALSHDNVVKAHSAMQFGDTLVFAMEYVEGDDLAKVVKAQGPLAVANACYYARQVALGLQHAHERGMVHRDIKPHNLILARIGKKHLVKILDFGLAKATSEKKVQTGLTQFGAMLGTPDYMAPEQSLDAASADIRADIYSLGCTLYYLLTGAPPFGAGSLLGLLQAHQTTTAKPLNLVRPEVPLALSAIVATMMAKEPAKRYQKPVEVAQELVPFFMKSVARGPGVPSSISLGESAKAEPDQTDMRQNDPTPSQTVIPHTKAAANDFSFAPEGLVQNPLAKKTKPKPKTETRFNLLQLAGVAVALGVLFLGWFLWGGGVFRLNTKDGILVVLVNEPNPDVYVDGERVTVTWGNGGKKAEISVKPGTRKVSVKKDGFTVHGEDVTLEDGDRQVLTVRLERKPLPQENSSQPPTHEATKARILVAPAIELSARNAFIKAGTWKVDGDVLVQEAIGYGELVFGDISWTDYNFSCESQWVGGSPEHGITVRNNPAGREMFFVGGWANKESCATMIRGDEIGNQRRVFSAAVSKDTWNRLSVQVRARHCECYRDGLLVLQYNDVNPNDLQGQVSLYTQGITRFRNIRVTDPKGKVLFHGMPESPAIKKWTPKEERLTIDPKVVPSVFIPLFNGKNLDGWQQVNSQRTQWSANNGILVGKGLGPTGPRNVGTLVTTRNDYQNFHLRVKTMMCDGQACNVAFRLGDNLDNFTKGLWANGYLLHLGGTKENPAVKKPIGSISDSKGRTHGKPQDMGIQPGRWYVIELIAEANHFKVFIDGKQVLDCEDEGSSFSRGRIALQCRPFTVVKFEQIEIKELP